MSKILGKKVMEISIGGIMVGVVAFVATETIMATGRIKYKYTTELENFRESCQDFMLNTLDSKLDFQ